MVSSLSATDRARACSSLLVWQVQIAVGGWMPVVGIALLFLSRSSRSPALRATAGATAHRLAQMRRVRPAARRNFLP